MRQLSHSLAALALILLGHSATTAQDAESIRRGRALFTAHCAICHQVTGKGTPGTYPPLARSDFLSAPSGKDKAIQAVVEGLGGRIRVNGVDYNNQMPAVVLDDVQVADVMSFVLNSWENPGGIVTADQVTAVRAKSRFPTFAALQAANAYPPLPTPPSGWSVREYVRLNDFTVRMAASSDGRRIYLLGQSGVVSKLDPATRKVTRLFGPEDYVDAHLGDPGTLGMLLDPKGRLWITCNQRQDSRPLVTNHVTIFRTSTTNPGGDPIRPLPWFRTAYPYGIGPYNHGVSHLAIGPDGLLYVSSGSRTDGGETGSESTLGRMGETDITACLWRFDPEAASPRLEVVARGIRNAWSFTWNDRRELFTASNGPDANAGEELDFVDPTTVRHHGFPYQFGDWPTDRKAYPHTPPAPAGLRFVKSVQNLGPDGWEGPLPGSTFSPHSSPAGMVWLGEDYPEAGRGSFLIGRFGTLLKVTGETDPGFDILSVRPRREGEGWVAETRTFLKGLGRPIDLLHIDRRIYVLEYTRPTDFRSGRGWLPGRILELTPSARSR